MKSNSKIKPDKCITGIVVAAFITIVPVLTLIRMAMQGIPLSQYKMNIVGKFKLIGFNTKFTELVSGGEYMESGSVLLGKDGWLFYKVDTDGTPLYDYMGLNRFSEDEMRSICDGIGELQAKLTEAGISSAILTIPNKEQVYSRYMPDTVEKISEVSRLDQFSQYVREKGKLKGYTDVSDVLKAEADKLPLYYKTDTHWTGVGAYVALKEVMKALDDEEGEDTDISGTVEEDCVVMDDGVRFVRTPDFEGDLARISATLDRYTDVSYQPDATSIPEEDKRDKTLLIIGDSFGDSMQQVAGQYYREVVFIQLTDYEESMIYEHSPDDVIIECVERYLPRLASY